MLPKFKNTHGFTLLEILIALFVFTIISMIMVSALHTVLTTQAVTEKNSARFNQLQIATLLLSRDLEQAIDRPVINNTGATEPALIGTATEIKFTHTGLANPNAGMNRSTLQRTHYFMRDNSLIRETWAELDITRDTPENQRKLHNDIDTLYFQYLDENGKFQTSWPLSGQNHAGLPRAVRVNITLKNSDKLSQTYVIPK